MDIGLDIGGTKILGGLIDGERIVSSRKVKTKAQQETSDQLLERIYRVIDELRADHSLHGIGIGIPGSVDPEKGVIHISPNLPIKDLPLKHLLEKRYKVPVAIGNDVNAGLLGEHWLGAAKGMKNVIGIFVGTGIGGGLIINDRMQLGLHGIAGEVGHMKLLLNGPLCNCGEHGCLEALASKTSMQRELEAQGYSFNGILKSSFLKEELDKDNRKVKDVIKNAASYLGQAIGSLINALDPEVVILGGGVIESIGSYLLRKLEPFAAARAMVKPDIRLSTLGDNAVLMGAVRLVRAADNR